MPLTGCNALCLTPPRVLVATKLENWRYMKHTEPHNLLPVTSEYPDARYITALLPDSACGNNSCKFGYCTTLPSLVWDTGANMALHRDANSLIPEIDVLEGAQCDCYPDVGPKQHSGECVIQASVDQIKCLDSCSFAGECSKGFCSCPPGYWGAGGTASLQRVCSSGELWGAISRVCVLDCPRLFLSVQIVDSPSTIRGSPLHGRAIYSQTVLTCPMLTQCQACTCMTSNQRGGGTCIRCAVIDLALMPFWTHHVILAWYMHLSEAHKCTHEMPCVCRQGCSSMPCLCPRFVLQTLRKPHFSGSQCGKVLPQTRYVASMSACLYCT
jgi:hypothetical protein